MSRIFISHSSKDNCEALAFQQWLVGEGWSPRTSLSIFRVLVRARVGARHCFAPMSAVRRSFSSRRPRLSIQKNV
jgi:hypothetical protein